MQHKKHILSKRAKIIKFLKTEGYSGQDIAIMFNIDRSQISRILSEEIKYKKHIKKMLSGNR